MSSPLFSTQASERFWRRLLGLPAEAPEPIAAQLHDGRIEFPSDEEKATAKAAWHAEDRRADVAAKLGDWTNGHRLRTRIASLVDRLSAAVDESAHRLSGHGSITAELAAQRQLHFASHYVQRVGETSSVEGYFDLPSGRHFPITVTAAGAIPGWVVFEAEKLGHIATEENSFLYGRYVLVPGKLLGPETVSAALSDWYRERFDFKRTHWSHRAGRGPEIVLDLVWEPAGTQALAS